MTAFRLAMLLTNIEKFSDVELNARSFHNHLTTILGTTEKPEILRQMIDKNGPLIKAFNELAGLIKYVGGHGVNIDCGFPSAMFPYMNESMLQVILYWLIHNQKMAASFNESREELTRFVLFWVVCSRDSASAYKASKVAIGIIFKHKGKFPGAEIYRELTKKEDDELSLFISLVAPVKIELISDSFRKQEDRAKHFFERDPALFHSFSSKKTLLLWLQRDWVANEFPRDKFTPIAGQDEDNVPYDFDHLIPQINWSSLQSIIYGDIKEEKNKAVFFNLHHRRVIGNSIGNYRVMNSSENRSRGKESINENLLIACQDWKNYAFNPDKETELGQWRIAASTTEDGNKWDDKRLLAFQYAIESRVLHLYERFYKEAKFTVWFNSNPV